jgi:hypothetical protein
MKKSHRVLIIIGILIIGWIFVRFVIGGSEDDWIKDDKGVWIKHGVPSGTPGYVIEQQQIIEQALALYEQKKAEGMEFSSQCLGVVIDYAVDIVSVPRSVEDNMVENQCESYRSGEVTHFIELDEDGNIVRII